MAIQCFSDYATDIMHLRYSHLQNGRQETWEQIARRVCYFIVGQGKPSTLHLPKDIIDDIQQAIIQRKLIPGGRQLSQTGRVYHQTDNCFVLRAEDTREGWAQLAYDTTMMFMSGGGVGVSYDAIRPYGTPLKRSGGIASGPVPLIHMVNSIAAAARQGGQRQGAAYASLAWNHQDIQQFIHMKDHGGLDHTNISVRFDHAWLTAFNRQESTAQSSFYDTVENTCQYGDPSFQFDIDDQILRNACTEVISADSADSCCLASVNFAAIKDLDELSDICQLGVIWLLCCTEYTDCPVPYVRQIKEKNRRLGLGIMGLAEWFIQRQLPYGYTKLQDEIFTSSSKNLHYWLNTYKHASDYAADVWADEFNMSRPIAVRAIAPTGTISIAGGHTTPGIEPVFHTAYIRTYNTNKEKEHHNGFQKRVIVDPIVSKMLEQGHDMQDIDTAYTLSRSEDGIERRIALQAFVQRYIDNGISSTVNLPSYTKEKTDSIKAILFNHLPQLRGITFYPNGARENQPVVPVDINDALKGENILEEHEMCKGETCGL